MAIGIAMLLTGVAPAAAAETVIGPPKEEVVPWRLQEPPEVEGSHTVAITLEGGYCGGPEPDPGAVSIVERPVSAAHPRPAAIITARQLNLDPLEVVGEVLPGEPSPIICAGVGWSATKRIRLKRPLKGMALFDGSSGRLKRRSPPGGMP
jgi:hypothetical protein